LNSAFCQFSWRSVLFTSKKDDSLQLCVNYCELNCITVKNRHSLSLISETLNWLSGAKIFIKLDLKDVYHCICICKDNEWKTAFHTHYDHFEYLIMSFELANAPATFQAYINWALAEHMNFICVVYLNDILIYSQSKEKHKHHVCEILEQLAQAVCQLKEMCFFYRHCRVLEIYSIHYWCNDEFTKSWHY
jgi:hypothetical protein